MRAVDTNVLVRLIAHDDEKQFPVARAFVENGVWVSHLVLVETLWVLSTAYGFRHSELAQAIEMLLNNRYVAVQDADVVAAALVEYRRRPSLTFTDCLVLEIARKAGHLPLGTFDKHLAKLEGTERL